MCYLQNPGNIITRDIFEVPFTLKCLSPCYNLMNHWNDFGNIILRYKSYLVLL